ncbi:hypothetical protein [Bdellovibrio sp. HCB209]|uniref:hypothetical protein n=1 Tax=Bdellovibrio sp. HCB209 TaxID=3394354 RepID=UPI0039B54191
MKTLILALSVLTSTLANAATVHNFINVKQNQNKSPIECDKLLAAKKDFEDMSPKIQSLRVRANTAFAQNDRELYVKLSTELNTMQKKEQQKKLLLDGYRAQPVNFDFEVSLNGLARFMAAESVSTFKDNNILFYYNDFVVPNVIPQVSDIQSNSKTIQLKYLQPNEDAKKPSTVITSGKLTYEDDSEAARWIYKEIPQKIVGNSNLAEFCENVDQNTGEIFSFKLTYKIPNTNSPLVVNMHLGWNLTPSAEMLQYNEDATKAMIKESIAPLLSEVFGESDLFQLDDKILVPFSRGQSRVIKTIELPPEVKIPGAKNRLVDYRYNSSVESIRETLTKAKQLLNQNDPLSNAMVLDQMNRLSSKTYSNGQIGITIANAGNEVEMLFASDAAGVYLERVLANKKEIFLTRDHMIQTSATSRVNINLWNPPVKPKPSITVKKEPTDWEKVKDCYMRNKKDKCQ